MRYVRPVIGTVCCPGCCFKVYSCGLHLIAMDGFVAPPSISAGLCKQFI